MNGKTTRRKHQMLITNSGEYCTHCGALPDESTLVINHKDNNLKNNELDNLQLLCRSCVFLKNETSEHDDQCVKPKTDEKTCLSINKINEPLFRQRVYCNLIEYEKISYKDTMNSEAEFLGLSPATTKKYLDKMTSPIGYLKTRKIYHDSIIEFKDEIYKKFAKMELENKGFVFE